MIGAILFALSIVALFFFTVFPWFLAWGGTLLRALPFVVVFALLAAGGWWLYRRSITRATERGPDAVRRARMAFGITLLVLAIPICILNFFGVYNAFYEGRQERRDRYISFVANSMEEVGRLEADYQEQLEQYGNARDIDAYVQSDLKRAKESLADEEEELESIKASKWHGVVGGLATLAFLAWSVFAGVGSIRGKGTGIGGLGARKEEN